MLKAILRPYCIPALTGPEYGRGHEVWAEQGGVIYRAEYRDGPDTLERARAYCRALVDRGYAVTEQKHTHTY